MYVPRVGFSSEWRRKKRAPAGRWHRLVCRRGGGLPCKGCWPWTTFSLSLELSKAHETWKWGTVLAEFIERSCVMIRGKDGITKTQINKIWRNAGRERVYLRLKGTGAQLKWRILTKKTQSFEIKMDPCIALGLPQKVFTWSFTDKRRKYTGIAFYIVVPVTSLPLDVRASTLCQCISHDATPY
jgi:hypothetical protein